MEKFIRRRSRRIKSRRRTSRRIQSRRRTSKRTQSRRRTSKRTQSRRRTSKRKQSRRRTSRKNMRGGQGTFDSLEEEIASHPSSITQLVGNRPPQTQEEEQLQLEMAIQNSLISAPQTRPARQELYFVLIPGSGNRFGHVPYQQKISQMIKDNLGERYILKSSQRDLECGHEDNEPAQCVEDKKKGRDVRRPCPDISYECLEDIFFYNYDKRKCLISTSQGSAILVQLLVNLLGIGVNCFENIECLLFFSPALIYKGETCKSKNEGTIIKFLSMCRDYNIPILLFHNEFGSFKFNPRLGDSYPYNNPWTNHIISYCDSHPESKSIPIRCTNHSFFIDGIDTKEEHNRDNYIYKKLEENGMDALIESLSRGDACGEKKVDNNILFSGILEKMFEWCVDLTKRVSIVGEIEGINANIERMVE